MIQAERRRKLGLPPEEPKSEKPAAPVEEKKVVYLLVLYHHILGVWVSSGINSWFYMIKGYILFCYHFVVLVKVGAE